MQALTTEHFALQSARALSAGEIGARSSLFLTALSAGVVALALVANASHFGEAFFVFALAILPVVFFLGVSAFGRILQNAVEFIAYQRSISRIRAFYRQIDPERAEYFQEPVDETVLAAVGIFKLRWQQFLAVTTMVAVVDGVVGGVFVALFLTRFVPLALWAATIVAAAITLLIVTVFLRVQWRAWKRVMAMRPRTA